MNVKQAERGRKVIFRAFTRLCFYSNSRMFDLLKWVSFPQVKLENILSHPALNTSGVERHMQLKLAVCVYVCFMSNKINRIQDPEYSISSFHRTGNMSASVCDIRASTQTRPITRSYFYSAVPPRAPADVRRKLFMSVSSCMNKPQDDRLKRQKTKHRRVHALQHAKQLWINE